jgi:hypothetical protein
MIVGSSQSRRESIFVGNPSDLNSVITSVIVLAGVYRSSTNLSMDLVLCSLVKMYSSAVLGNLQQA